MEFFLEDLHRNLETYKGNNAFHIEGEFFTYEQLGKRITAIQQKILSYNNQQYFGVIVRNSIDTYATIFALWLSGKTSVPLSPKTPAERNKNILEQVGILTLFDAGSEPLVFDESTTIGTMQLEATNASVQYHQVNDDTDLYLLFTSGSTGLPKGVRISRENLNAYLNAFFACGYNFSPADKCLQVYELTFDASVQCYTFPLLWGATVYTLPADEMKFLATLKVMQNHAITFVKMSPSTIYYLQPYFDRIHLPALRYCLFGAEAFPVELVRKWENCVPNAIIHNVYGPTEATINCTYYPWKRKSENKSMNGIASIGKAYQKLKTIVVDAQGNVLAAGEKGELCVTGSQVTKGYWENPENNKRAFFSLNGNRYYRTGDLALMDDEGDIFYLGRLDTQVQINGHRIELSEIENHAINYTKVKCVAMAQQNNELAHSILLFVESRAVSKDDLLNYLRRYLPEYMIPEKVILMEQIPLLASGKTDRQQLLKLAENA